jgi:hypothetical protein
MRGMATPTELFLILAVFEGVVVHFDRQNKWWMAYGLHPTINQ